jgi:hypothetical protein
MSSKSSGTPRPPVGRTFPKTSDERSRERSPGALRRYLIYLNIFRSFDLIA